MNALSMETLAKYPSGERTCPRCHRELPVTVEWWYANKDGGMHGHCKDCVKQGVGQRQRERKAGVPPTIATCHICKDRRSVKWSDEPDFAICRDCAEIYVTHGSDRVAVLRDLAPVVAHNIDVERRRLAHRTDKMFIPHPGTRGFDSGMFDKSAPWRDHRDCITWERSLRQYLKHLSR